MDFLPGESIRPMAGQRWCPHGTTEGSSEVVRRWDEVHSRVVKLGQEIEKLDEDYLSGSGTMIYTTKKPRLGNAVINVMRTTIQ